MPAYSFWALLALALCGTAHGQPSPPAGPTPTCSSGQPGSIYVAGRGQAQATADVAKVSLYVQVTNQTAEGAKAVAAGIANDVIAAVRKVEGVFPENVTLTTVSVYPNYDTAKQSRTSVIVGYTYSNYLSISLGNLTGDLLSEVLDTAVKNGGDNLTISSTSFSLSPEVSYGITMAARTQAAADAKTTAQQYTQGLGVRLGPLLSVVDQSASSTPVQIYESSSSDLDPSANDASSSPSPGAPGGGSGDTPISLGMQRVSAEISVLYTTCDTET